MNISCQWLKTYCPDLTLTAEELADRLLLAGFPVEAIKPAGDGDQVLEVEVTTNRPDLLGHLGMAREVAALTGCRFVPPSVNPPGQSGADLAQATSVKLLSGDCPYYTARLIRDVRVGPSPAWLARRLESVGLRPVNNVVDVTNFVLFEYSQPLHAFDHGKLEGGRIVVRKARPGEKLVSIDGHLRELDASMLVIADASKPVAVAGVMGGLDTEVGSKTTTVLLESAYFDPMSVRATARKLGLFSDSSYRFERAVDPAGVEAASCRAADLLVELCGGRAVPGLAVDPDSRAWLEQAVAARTVTMRLARMRAVVGIDVPAGRIVEILAGLQLQPRLSDDGELVTVTVPSFRQDLRREVDLIEEVARVEGYDRIPVRDRIDVVVRPPSFRQATIRRIAGILCGQGLFETVSITFVPADQAELFARGGPGRLEVVHSSRKAESALRRSLLPSLLVSRRRNETVQAGRADLFEIAAVFEPTGQGPAGSAEPLRLGLCTDGDFRHARGVLEELVGQLDRTARLTFVPTRRAELVADESAAVMLDGREIGLIGRLDPAVLARFELRQEVTVAEVDVEPLLALAGKPRSYRPLARFPAIERDLSILVDESVHWADVERVVRDSAPPELEHVQFADLFRGKQFPPGKKSFTFALRYRQAEGTLTHEQANAFVARTVEALGRQLGAALRDK